MNLPRSVLGDSLYWMLRGRLSSQAKLIIGISLLVWVVLWVPQRLSETHSIAVGVVLIVLMTAYMISAQFFGKRICKSFGDAAVVCDYKHVATPFTSLVSGLREEGIEAKDIDRITIETGLFSDLLHYMNGDGKRIVELVKENPEAVVHVYGLNDLSVEHHLLKEQLTKIGAPSLIFHDTKSISRTHRNVIRTHQGKSYIWFEEYHEIENGHHYFPRGAFLLNVDEAMADKVEHDVANAVPFRYAS